MQKKVLSEIDLYYGEIITPKGFEIKRDIIKNSILDSFLKFELGHLKNGLSVKLGNVF